MVSLAALNELTGGQNYVINLKSRPDRKDACKAQFEKYGLDSVFIEAVYGVEDPDVQKRLPHIKGYTPNGDSVTSENNIDKAGKGGATRSHLKLIRKAISDIKELKENGKPVPRFIGMFEDDVNFEAIPNHKAILEASAEILQHIPDDAGMVYLGGNQRYNNGYIPIKENNTPDGLMQVSSSFSGYAILINTDFLEILERIVSENTRVVEDKDSKNGGEEPIDMVYAMLHAYLALGEIPSKESGADYIAELFEQTLAESEISYRPCIYALNPLIAGDQSRGAGELGTSNILKDFKPDYSDVLKTGETLNTVSREQAIEIRNATQQAKKLQETLPKADAKIAKTQLKKLLDEFSTKINPDPDRLLHNIKNIASRIQPENARAQSGMRGM